MEDLRGGSMDPNEFVSIGGDAATRGSRGRNGDMGLKRATFERDMVLEVTVVLKGDGEVGLPLVVGVFEEEEHGSTGAVNGGREHGEDAAGRSIGMVGRSRSEGNVGSPGNARGGVGDFRKEGVGVGGGGGGMTKVRVAVKDPVL
jgi:hypothetical protein